MRNEIAVWEPAFYKKDILRKTLIFEKILTVFDNIRPLEQNVCLFAWLLELFDIPRLL